MAIYGDFDSQSFNDIIRILQRHVGILFVPTALNGHSIELHLNQGMLCALFVDDVPIHEVLEVQQTVRGLVDQASGSYHFSFNEKTLNYHFSIPIMDLAREAVGSAQISEQQLPHHSTKFQSVVKLPPVPSNLQSNWVMLEPLLSKGTSADDVNAQLQLSLVEAQMILYRLRAAGLIEPQRAVNTHIFKGSRKGLVRHLLHTLRRLTQRGAV